MRVIKKGIPPGEKLYIATCLWCKSEVEFKANEGKFTDDQRDGSYITVRCPVCENEIHKSTK